MRRVTREETHNKTREPEPRKAKDPCLPYRVRDAVDKRVRGTVEIPKITIQCTYTEKETVRYTEKKPLPSYEGKLNSIAL